MSCSGEPPGYLPAIPFPRKTISREIPREIIAGKFPVKFGWPAGKWPVEFPGNSRAPIHIPRGISCEIADHFPGNMGPPFRLWSVREVLLDGGSRIPFEMYCVRFNGVTTSTLT